MGNPSFARARKFLNYNPLAKWLALIGAVGTGILYVALLLVLALFADLMVNRGHVPCYANLSYRNRLIFLDRLEALNDSAERAQEFPMIRRELDALGIKDQNLVKLAVSENPQKLSEEQQELRRELLWFTDLGP